MLPITFVSECTVSKVPRVRQAINSGSAKKGSEMQGLTEMRSERRVGRGVARGQAFEGDVAEAVVRRERRVLLVAAALGDVDISLVGLVAPHHIEERGVRAPAPAVLPRAGNRRFGPLSALHANTKTPYKTDLP